MEGGRREDSKSSLPLVGDIVVLLYKSHLTLVKSQKRRVRPRANSCTPVKKTRIKIHPDVFWTALEAYPQPAWRYSQLQGARWFN